MKLSFIPICISYFLLLACSHTDKENEKLIVHLGCDEFEIVSDLQYSSSKIKDWLGENNISLIEETETQICGYTLIKGTSSKEINTAMTDVDLVVEISNFFELDH